MLSDTVNKIFTLVETVKLPFIWKGQQYRFSHMVRTFTVSHTKLFFITHWINGLTIIIDYKWCMYSLWLVTYVSVFFNVAAVACITVTLVYSGTGDLKHTSCIILYRFDQIELNQMFSYHVKIILCFEMIMWKEMMCNESMTTDFKRMTSCYTLSVWSFVLRI